MDARQLLGQLTASPGATGLAGGLVGGGLMAALTSKGGRKMLGKAATLGGVAALGGLAYHAWTRYQNNPRNDYPPATVTGTRPSADPDQVRERFVPAPEQLHEHRRLSENILQAMVTAAQADGTIDEAERQRIDEHLSKNGLAMHDRQALARWMAEPADPARVARLARNQEEAAELYLATLLTIDMDHWIEQAYVGQLREHLGLDPALAAELERSAAAGMAPVAA